MVKAAVISLGSTSSQWTIDAMKNYFDQVDNINLKELEISISGKNASLLYKGKPLEEYDCIYAKGSFRYSQVLRSLSTILQEKCYMPIASEAFTVAHDKLLTHLMLQQYNVPMPKTYISTTINAARDLLSKMNYPIIMKFPQGTQGKGVMFADSYSSASSILDALSALKQSFIIQEYVETSNSDVRAFVVGEKVVAAMVRRGKSDEKRANIHAGGVGEPVELDPYTKEIAIKAAQAAGADICGVDILEGAKGPVVLEVNISPGLQGITKATKVDVADKIARYLYRRATEHLNKKHNMNKSNIMTDVNNGGEIITNVEFRGSRILLPELATTISRISNKDQVQISMKKGRVSLDKLDIN